MKWCAPVPRGSCGFGWRFHVSYGRRSGQSGISRFRDSERRLFLFSRFYSVFPPGTCRRGGRAKACGAHDRAGNGLRRPRYRCTPRRRPRGSRDAERAEIKGCGLVMISRVYVLVFLVFVPRTYLRNPPRRASFLGGGATLEWNVWKWSVPRSEVVARMSNLELAPVKAV